MLKTAFIQMRKTASNLSIRVFECCVFSSIMRTFNMRNNDIADSLLNFSYFWIYSLILFDIFLFSFFIHVVFYYIYCLFTVIKKVMDILLLFIKLVSDIEYVNQFKSNTLLYLHLLVYSRDIHS